MSKSKIENRLNTMRHKQAQPTDSLILAESAEGKDFSQELSKAQPFDEIPSLTEKQVAFGMCNPQAHLDAKQEKLERFKKKRAEKKLALAIDKSSFPNPTEDYDARSVAAPNNPSFEELLEIGMKLQNQPAPPSPEELIVKKGPKTQSLVGMTRELQKKVSIISYHGALYFFNGRYYEYLDTDRLLMLYREYVDYDLNHESSLYGHKDLYQCCATDPEIQREEPKGEPIYAPLKNGIFVLGEEKLYPHSPDQLTFTCIKAKYDPQAKCPVFDRFLWQITHGNPQLLERFWMAIGYLFIYPARGKFFILMGYARDSGKSVLGNFIQRLYPKESVSNLRLSEMKGTFALMPLLSSVINFELDMPNTKLNAEAISRLKQITGGDSIDVQRKYLSSVVLTRRIKFVFASNHPPCIEGEDDALLKRIVYLPFDTSIPDDQQDPDLEEKIWKERNAIVTKALRYAQKLVELNYRFPEIPQVDRAKCSTKDAYSGSVKPFVQECCERCDPSVEGKKYPGTNVEYKRVRVQVDGVKKEGVFPQFEAKDVERLPKNMYQASDAQQFSHCTKKLAQKLEGNSTLEGRFTPRQLEQIRDGAPRISGLTWHHTEHPGVMQLVDSDIHSKCRHTGGRNVWGGGSECR